MGYVHCLLYQLASIVNPDQPDRDRDLVLNKSWIHQEMKQSVGTSTRLPEAVGLGWVGQS